MNLLRQTSALLACIAVSLLAPSARATTINGTAFCNISGTDANNTPAPGQVHTGTECATFTSSSIAFNANGGGTLGIFLNPNVLIGSVTYLNGFSASSTLDTTLFTFTGTAFFTQGQTYSATHDDGTVMMVGNATYINSPGPTPPLTNTFVFSNPTGNYNFQYNYTEAYGGSLYTTDATVSPVPEPGSVALCGTGLLLLAGFARKRLTSSGSPAVTIA